MQNISPWNGQTSSTRVFSHTNDNTVSSLHETSVYHSNIYIYISFIYHHHFILFLSGWTHWSAAMEFQWNSNWPVLLVLPLFLFQLKWKSSIIFYRQKYSRKIANESQTKRQKKSICKISIGLNSWNSSPKIDRNMKTSERERAKKKHTKNFDWTLPEKKRTVHNKIDCFVSPWRRACSRTHTPNV